MLWSQLSQGRIHTVDDIAYHMQHSFLNGIEGSIYCLQYCTSYGTFNSLKDHECLSKRATQVKPT